MKKITWSVIYLTKQGFEAFVTVEGDSIDEVLAEGEKVLARMRGKVKPVRSGPAWPIGRQVVKK